MRYICFVRNLFPREFGYVIKRFRKIASKTYASERFAIPAVRDFHGNRNPPGSENPQRVVAKGEGLRSLCPRPPYHPLLLLPSSLPPTPAVDQCVDGFHFRGVKVLHHRKLKSLGTVEETGSRIAIHSMIFSALAIISHVRGKFFVILIWYFNNIAGAAREQMVIISSSYDHWLHVISNILTQTRYSVSKASRKTAVRNDIWLLSVNCVFYFVHYLFLHRLRSISNSSRFDSRLLRIYHFPELRECMKQGIELRTARTF